MDQRAALCMTLLALQETVRAAAASNSYSSSKPSVAIRRGCGYISSSAHSTKRDHVNLGRSDDMSLDLGTGQCQPVR